MSGCPRILPGTYAVMFLRATISKRPGVGHTAAIRTSLKRVPRVFLLVVTFG